MSRTAIQRNRDDRELSLILTDSGAELIDNESGMQLWASDSDDTFREEFPDVLGDEDYVAVLDYLVDQDLISEEEADEADVLTAETPPGPGTEPEEGDEDGDEDEDGDDE